LHIFFDVDGVLINGFHTKAEKRVRWDTHIQQDLGIDPENFQTFFTETYFLRSLLGKIDLEDNLQKWLSENHYQIKAGKVIEYWMAKDSNLNTDLMPVIETLASCPDIVLHIATNQEHIRAAYLWNDVGFQKYFDNIFYSAKFGCFKRDKNFFTAAMKELAITPGQEKIIYFDDDPKNIEVANALGWDAVLYDQAEQVTGHPDLAHLFA